MIRLNVVKVSKGHNQFLAKTLQPAKCIDKEGNVAGNVPSVKYTLSTDRWSGNQRMMIKVRHTDCQGYACARRAQSGFMEGIYCKKYQWGP